MRSDVCRLTGTCCVLRSKLPGFSLKTVILLLGKSQACGCYISLYHIPPFASFLKVTVNPPSGEVGGANLRKALNRGWVHLFIFFPNRGLI